MYSFPISFAQGRYAETLVIQSIVFVSIINRSSHTRAASSRASNIARRKADNCANEIPAPDITLSRECELAFHCLGSRWRWARRGWQITAGWRCQFVAKPGKIPAIKHCPRWKKAKTLWLTEHGWNFYPSVPEVAVYVYTQVHQNKGQLYFDPPGNNSKLKGPNCAIPPFSIHLINHERAILSTDPILQSFLIRARDLNLNYFQIT